MNRLQSSLTLAFLCTVSTLGLSGCAGFGDASFPNAAVNPTQTSVGALQGSVYGGHAPLVGAHIYMLEAGSGGYGAVATSLLGNDTANGYTNCKNNAPGSTACPATTVDPNISESWYYQTTDSTGSFNITGEYSCTAGLPIYLYGYGGSPTYPSATNVFATSSFYVESNNGGGSYTLLFTTTGVELFYVGEVVKLSGFTGTSYTFLNSQTPAVLAANLSQNQFEVTVTGGSGLTAGTTYTTTGTVTGQPTNNPGVVNLAMLGVCPSSGTLASGGLIFNGSTSAPINYIKMNEVSTVAMAFAMEGFAPTGSSVTSTTNATDLGTSSGNLIGIENATLDAALLYNISGNGPQSTVYDGEGDIANTVTPTFTVGSISYGGNGAVPQNLLDTLGNILAACVDSNDQSSADGNAAESGQCKQLFETATSNGIPTAAQGGSSGAGTIPIDTAQAAFNIAHYPGGNPTYSTKFVSNLYSLPSGNVPFTPNLVSTGAGVPNDFTVAISYPYVFTANTKITSAGGLAGNDYANGVESLAIDGYGNVWVDSIAKRVGYEISAQGIQAYAATNDYSGAQLGYVTIDPSNNVWWGNHSANTGETEIVQNGTANLGSLFGGTAHLETVYNGNYSTTSGNPFYGGGDEEFFDGYASVSNWAGDILIGAAVEGYTSSGFSGATWYTLGITGTPGSTNNSAGTQTDYIANPTPICPGVASPCSPAEIGHGAIQNKSAGNVWWTGEYFDFGSSSGNASNFVALVNATTGTVVSGYPIFYSTATTNNQNSILDPTNLAVDSNGNAWVAAQNNGSGNSVLKVTGAGSVQPYNATSFSAPFAVAIDGGNNAFVTNRNNDTGTSIAVFNTAGSGTTLSPPTTGYTLGGQLLAPLNDALDQSGNLWITCYQSGSTGAVVQWIGAGLPTGNPLAAASNNNTLGTTP